MKAHNDQGFSADDVIARVSELIERADEIINELEMLSVFATVAHTFDKGKGLTAEGLFGADWAPLAAVALHRIRELLDPLSRATYDAKEILDSITDDEPESAAA